MSDKIYLSIEQLSEDRFIIVDQDGRQVSGLKALKIDQRLNDVTSFEATIVAMGSSGAPICGRYKV